MKAELTMEFSNKKITEEELVKIAKKTWTDAGNKVGAIKSLELYVQPENNTTYFVINSDFKGDFTM